MSDEALARACECLRINGVAQARVSAFIDEALEGTPAFPDDFEILFKHAISKSLWGDTAGENGRIFMLRVFIELGVRFVPAANSGKESEQEQAGDSDTLAQIEATYIAEYISDEDPGNEAIKAFAARNASFHVWPYWREFITSQCNRMNLPRINLPLHTFGRQESD